MKMKKNNLITILLTLILTLFMINVNAFALSPETEVLLKLLVKKGVITQEEAASLQQEVEAVAPKGLDKETLKAEIKEELKAEGGILGGLQDNITLSGEVAVDYKFVDHRDRTDANSDSTSDLFASTVKIGVEAQANEFTTLNIVFLAEDIDKSDGTPNTTPDADKDKAVFDEATITIFNQEKCPIYAVLGKRGQPFAQFFTHTISDPVTKSAYDIATTGATIGYAPANFFDLDAALTVYKGEKLMNQVAVMGGLVARNNSVGYAETDDVSSYIASLSAKPIEELAIGVAFNSEPGDDSRNETLSAFAEFSMAGFTFDAEYFTATKREKHFADNKDYKDKAYVVGLAYQVIEPLELALRYENYDNDRSTDASGYFDHTIAFGANYNLFENVTLMGEYRNLKEKKTAGSTYEDTVNEFNLRVAVGF